MPYQKSSYLERKLTQPYSIPITKGVNISPPAYGIPFLDQLPAKSLSNSKRLPTLLKTGIEQLSGMDMSDVKIHYNSSQPAQLKAYAFTKGRDIHLGPGQEKHLAHEAWHVVQQKRKQVKPTSHINQLNINNDPQLEREADIMGTKALKGPQASRNDYAISPANHIASGHSYPVIQMRSWRFSAGAWHGAIPLPPNLATIPHPQEGDIFDEALGHLSGQNITIKGGFSGTQQIELNKAIAKAKHELGIAFGKMGAALHTTRQHGYLAVPAAFRKQMFLNFNVPFNLDNATAVQVLHFVDRVLRRIIQGLNNNDTVIEAINPGLLDKIGLGPGHAAGYVYKAWKDVFESDTGYDKRVGLDPSKLSPWTGSIYLDKALGDEDSLKARIIHEASHRFAGLRDFAYHPTGTRTPLDVNEDMGFQPLRHAVGPHYTMANYRQYLKGQVPHPLAPAHMVNHPMYKAGADIERWYKMSFVEAVKNADSIPHFVHGVVHYV